MSCLYNMYSALRIVNHTHRRKKMLRSSRRFVIMTLSIFTSAGLASAQDLVPLKLYWNHHRGDNFVTATSDGARDAEGGGYTFARIEACVFRTKKPGTVPL